MIEADDQNLFQELNFQPPLENAWGWGFLQPHICLKAVACTLCLLFFCLSWHVFRKFIKVFSVETLYTMQGHVNHCPLSLCTQSKKPIWPQLYSLVHFVNPFQIHVRYSNNIFQWMYVFQFDLLHNYIKVVFLAKQMGFSGAKQGRRRWGYHCVGSLRERRGLPGEDQGGAGPFHKGDLQVHPWESKTFRGIQFVSLSFWLLWLSLAQVNTITIILYKKDLIVLFVIQRKQFLFCVCPYYCNTCIASLIDLWDIKPTWNQRSVQYVSYWSCKMHFL